MTKKPKGYVWTPAEIAARLETWAAVQTRIEALQAAGNAEYRSASAEFKASGALTPSQTELQERAVPMLHAAEDAVRELGLDWQHIKSLRTVIEADTADDNPTIVGQWLTLMGVKAIRPRMPGDSEELSA